MTMNILFLTENKNKAHAEWYIGKSKPPIGASNIINIQADGDELNLIRQRCKGIPDIDAKIVTWHGDFAKFIFSNVVTEV